MYHVWHGLRVEDGSGSEVSRVDGVLLVRHYAWLRLPVTTDGPHLDRSHVVPDP